MGLFAGMWDCSKIFAIDWWCLREYMLVDDDFALPTIVGSVLGNRECDHFQLRSHPVKECKLECGRRQQVSSMHLTPTSHQPNRKEGPVYM